jgi:hypothetical protein
MLSMMSVGSKLLQFDSSRRSDNVDATVTVRAK